MRTIIAGSRDITVPTHLKAALRECGWLPTVVISGTAHGADRLGESWAVAKGVPVERYPANWAAYGKSAGHKRNAEMAAVAEALIALWDGRSKGTKSMIEIAERAGLRVYVHLVK